MVYIKHLHIYTSRFVENLAYNLRDVLKRHIECSVHIKQLTPDDVKKLKLNEYFMLISPQSTLAQSSLTVLKPNTYFIYQTEQLNTKERANKFHNNKSMFTLFNNAYQIFDYSKDNMILYPEKYNKPPMFLPFISANNADANATTNATTNNKTIDILFYGSLNQRRYIIIEVLRQLLPQLNIVVEEQLFGKELQEKIKQSKIVLNIHNYEHATLEIARIMEAMTYDVHIISEKTHEVELMASFENVHFIDELIDYTEKSMKIIDIDKNYFKNVISIINRLLNTHMSREVKDNKNIDIIENLFFPFKIIDAVNYKVIYEGKQSNNNNNNKMIYSCHITMNSNFIINEFLKHSLFDNIDTIIVVYSVDQGINEDIIHEYIELFNKYADNCKIIFLKDQVNKYFDVGKIPCGYDYIVKNNIDINYIHLVNDSIIPTKNIEHIYQSINDNMRVNDLVGIIESMQINKHYQSWWLCMNKKLFYYYVQNLYYFNISHYPQCDVIYKNEVELCNNIIKKHNTSALYNNILKNNENIFYNGDKEYNTLYNKGFHFVKVKRMNNIIKCPPLKLNDDILYIYKCIQ